ncbi:MAG TPA: serine protease [Bdellovibrionota bacterium]|nr:serine protease [Bdellovibrionota bacterium]
MNKLRLAVTVAITCFCSLATADEGFYNWTELKPENTPANADRLARASIFITPHCSGVVISPDGYVLTALHCVESCFSKLDGTLDQGLAAVEQDDEPRPFYYIFSVQNQRPEKVVCSKLSSPGLGLSNPRLVATGRGYAYFDDSKAMQFSQSLFDRFVSTQDDFALLKFETELPLTCVKPASRPASTGDRIWAIGYPRATTRSNGHGSDGKSQLVSYGTVYDGLEHNTAYRSLPPAVYARLREFNGTQNIISGMDIFIGNSGSMAANESGELVGINVAGAVLELDEARRRYFDGSAVTLRIEHIQSELQRVAPGLGKEAFGCRE